MHFLLFTLPQSWNLLKHVLFCFSVLWSVNLSISLSICLFSLCLPTSLFLYPFVYFSLCLSTSLFLFLFVYFSLCLSTSLFLFLFVYPSGKFFLFVNQSVCFFSYLFVLKSVPFLTLKLAYSRRVSNHSYIAILLFYFREGIFHY